MKRCPVCQKTFADTMKFCQTDGTPLVEDTPVPDPYKTIVGSSIKNDDLLQIPEEPDPMKTMISSPGMKPSEPKKESSSPFDAPPPVSAPPKVESKPFVPESPKSSEPSLNPPSFGDLSPQSGSTSSGNTKPRSFDATFSSIEPPAFGSVGNPSSPFDRPVESPFANKPKSQEKDEPPPTAFGGAPFEMPRASSAPPPPYKEPEPFNPGGNSPFDSPQMPFGQSNDPWASPQQQQQQQPFGVQSNDWAPPPAPVANWQDQGLGANTPFQSPVAVGGQNNTLAIVSLVCGILGLCLCGPLAGIPAIITGYMAKNNADTNPGEYGGRGMALAGMILGGISIVFAVLYVIFMIISTVAR